MGKTFGIFAVVLFGILFSLLHIYEKEEDACKRVGGVLVKSTKGYACVKPSEGMNNED